jgi:predicted dehydrogenase
VRFENGARGVVEGTTNCYPGMATRTQIFGTKGSAEFDGGKVVSLKVLDEEIDLETAEDQDKDGRSDPLAIGLGGHAAQLHDFVQAIREDRSPQCDGPAARVAVDCLTKIYRKAGYTGKLGT